MFGFIVSFIYAFVRTHALRLGVLSLGTYSAVEATFGAEGKDTAILISLGLIALSAAVWAVLGYAIGAAARWITGHLNNRHHIHH